MTCQLCGLPLTGTQKKWCSRKCRAYGAYVRDAETLFDILLENPDGLTVAECGEMLTDRGGYGTMINMVRGTLQRMIPDNVIVKEYGRLRFARSFDDGATWIFGKLRQIKQMSDNVEMNIQKLIDHFGSDGELSDQLRFALKSASLTSDAIGKAIVLTR